MNIVIQKQQQNSLSKALYVRLVLCAHFIPVHAFDLKSKGINKM